MTRFLKPGSGLSRLSLAGSNPSGPFAILGAEFQGGYFAGTISDGGVLYGLVLAPIATEVSGLAWKSTQTDSAGTSSTTNGPGNTAAIDNASHPAAQYCAGLSEAGYSDWYLPAINEWLAIYAEKGALPPGEWPTSGVAPTGYWSSTTTAATSASALVHSTGGTSNFPKDVTTVRTRAVRRFLAGSPGWSVA